jgi:hypothetical protein
MQLRLYDVIVNETLKFKSLNSTNLSHSISVIGDSVDGILVIHFKSYGVVSCFPTFEPIHMEFETFKQAGLLSNQLLQKHVAPFGYYPSRHTPGSWLHKTR